MKIGLVNRALHSPDLQDSKGACSCQHQSVGRWLKHLDENVVIDKISKIINKHSVKPEQWHIRDEVVDEC